MAIALLTAGHRVRAIKRAASVVKHLSAFDVEWVDASLEDSDGLVRAVSGSDAVFHLAASLSIRRRPTAELVRTNVDGTHRVVEAVKRAGVARLVHCSTVGAVGLSTDGAPCTEAARWNFTERGMDDGYVVTKRRAEEVVLGAVQNELDGVIVNPTYMLGPYDARPSSGKMIVDVVLGRVPGHTPGLNNFVDVRDVARGMVLAWEKGKRGERYILGGENLTYREAFARIAAAAGVAPPTRQIPRPLAYTLGAFGDLQESMGRGDPLVNSVTVKYGFCKDFIFSSDKARRELGYTTSPLDQAIRDAITWFRANGKLPRQ